MTHWDPVGTASRRTETTGAWMAGRRLTAVFEWLRARGDAAAGGPARRYVVFLLACVLALDSADSATVGAVAVQLEQSLHMDNTSLGLLVSASSFAGAAATLPFGMMVDRTRRTTLLAWAIFGWSASMAASALATSFVMLLISRIALGAVIGAAGPAIASLIGDFFPADERSRIYGLILGGELVGAGAGYIVSGEVAGALSWRAAFVLLALPGLALAWAFWRRLPEPARGGASQLVVGADDFVLPEEDQHVRAAPEHPTAGAADRQESRAAAAVRRRNVDPIDRLVLRTDPRDMSMWAAVRYVLRIRTNVVLIAASALGYFFFSGLRTFALVFVRGHFGLSQTAASSLVPLVGIGALVGVVASGRVADGLFRRGRLDARIVVPAVAFVAAAVVFVPGLLTTSLAAAIPLYALGAGLLSAANPPLDAARLDIMHFRLWGRAESVRTVLRTLAQGTAPVLFGFVSDELAGAVTRGAPTGPGGFTQAGQSIGGRGLEYTLLIMLVTLLGSGLILFTGRSSYPRDVATAAASQAEGSDRSAT